MRQIDDMTEDASSSCDRRRRAHSMHLIFDDGTTMRTLDLDETLPAPRDAETLRLPTARRE